MNLEPMQKAAVLIEALPYIQRFNRKIVVVKYGGSAMVDEELKKKVIQDVVLLILVGFKPIIGYTKTIDKMWLHAYFSNPAADLLAAAVDNDGFKANQL